MLRFAWVVATLYVLALLALTAPMLWLAFFPATNVVADLVDWSYWLWLAMMMVCQISLLAVPIRVASRRPVTRGALWPTVLAGALMMALLTLGAALSVNELIRRDDGYITLTLVVGPLSWCIWAVVFARMGSVKEPADFVTSQCKLLLKGSILELLIAVPTHIVARYRSYCCAGALTFVGLTMGISVMLFSFRPCGVFPLCSPLAPLASNNNE